MSTENSSEENKAKALSQDVVMPRRLTAENGAKALLMGEFFEEREISYYNEDGEFMETIIKVPISWSTIKSIYDKIVSHYVA